MMILEVIHPLAGLVVLAEALNKLERADPTNPFLTRRDRVVEYLKALAWLLLALGAGGALAAPFLITIGISQVQTDMLLRIERPTLAETMVLCGFAALIVRTRVKEG